MTLFAADPPEVRQGSWGFLIPHMLTDVARGCHAIFNGLSKFSVHQWFWWGQLSDLTPYMGILATLRASLLLLFPGCRLAERSHRPLARPPGAAGS